MPPKRPSDAGLEPADSLLGPKPKLARLDRGPEDFSNVVKTKLQSHTRTGQACDRCKVRKIRCDALPEGCSHCINQNLECYVTDRVTGRTERRGYMQQLEREKNDMVSRIRELEKLLGDNGIEVQPWEPSSFGNTYPPGVAFDAMGNPTQDPSSADQWARTGSLWIKNGHQQARGGLGGGYGQYSVLETRPVDRYLGVSVDNAPLSSIKGTTLSIMGTTIDITSFEAPDSDEPPAGASTKTPLYNKSVMAFLQSITNTNPPLENVELPLRQDAFTYAEWYFIMISAFLPILHKPSFLKLLTSIYDDPNFKATVPELVVCHMVFATIYFQYGIRNREEPEKQAQLNDLSNKHYHWCLSKFCDLAASQTMTAVQALVMIAVHARNFPKPGASTVAANFALTKAIELNLHRATKVPRGGTNIDNEVRKRAWWSSLGLVVTLNGRLGRPMPITLEEFDVDFPIAIADEYLTEEGVTDPSKIGQCGYMVGLVGYKSVPLYLEMYASIYCARRDPKNYISTVKALEQGMRSLEENLPDDLKLESCKPGTQIFALYTQAIFLEFYLCLRHPSVCITSDPKFCAENTKVCEESAQKLLKVVSSLLKVKSLDTTWYQVSVYVAALFTQLVANWERRLDMTTFEVAKLREEMALWLNVISETANFVGSGARLVNDIGAIIDRTIAWIEHDTRKDASPSQAVPVKPDTLQMGATKTQYTPNTTASGTPADQRNGTPNGNGTFYAPGVANASAAYPHLGYADQSAAASLPPQNGGGNAPTSSAYELAETAQYLYANTSGTGGPASSAEQPTPAARNPLVAFASQATQHVSSPSAEDWRPQAQAQAEAQAQAQLMAATAQGGNPWNDWTAAIADSQDRYSANALLTLGAARAEDIGQGTVAGGDADLSSLGVAGAVTAHTGQWPLLLFPDGSGGAETGS